jgi:hypothetical protein
MARKYYSSRKQSKRITADELHTRLVSLFQLFRDKDFFKEKTGLTEHEFPKSLSHEAVIFLGIEPFPLEHWLNQDKTEGNIFDVIEFLYDRISQPIGWGQFQTETGFNYSDYESYDEFKGKTEFRTAANVFLSDWDEGFELDEDGEIRRLGSAGIQFILTSEIVSFDKRNVDDKVRQAVSKWRSRHRTLEDMKEAVRLLADVFEFLKDAKQLSQALDAKDSSDIFNIANNFSIRHHNQQQKANYDPFIWYSWMFHFYLATYHATIRLIQKKQVKQLGT